MSSSAFATVHAHRRGASHAIVRRSAATHSMHTTRAVEHASFQNIASDRATQIQSALIQRGYLSGEPTGTWDSASVAAMQKLQSDSGWQTKYVPDSRALIKLGLGAGSSPAAVSPVQATASTSSTEAAAPVTTGQSF